MEITPGNMGRLVGVRATLTRSTRYGHEGSGPCRRIWVREECPKARTGWVVGFATKQEGTVTPSYDGEECQLAVDRRLPVVKVAFWPTMNPVFVLHEDIVEPTVPQSPAAIGWERYPPLPAQTKETTHAD